MSRILQRQDFSNVLIADDDPQVARLMLEILARKGIRANLANDKQSAVDFLDKGTCALVFVGEKIRPRSDSSSRSPCGLELLRKIRQESPEMPVIMMAEEPASQGVPAGSEKDTKRGLLHQTAEAAIRAIHEGCSDFLIKPLDRQRIENLLDTFLPNHDVATIAAAQQGTCRLYQIVGRSPKLVQTVTLAEKVAPTSVPVLITGESGTGKELISYLVHHKSKRAQGPYIKVNCAALSDSLLESELFGHEKGAFTGAYYQRKGRFEMAHGGTLLLDEITETPVKFQAKLLRILEQQDFERVGGNENVRVDVRMISTTNKDLLQEVRRNRFRRDLYYRLSGVRLVIAPLRERHEDLPDLVWHFVNLYARETQRRIVRLDPAMMDIFANYDWPGNVRQLRNVVRTSLILGFGETLCLPDVSWLFDELQPLPQEKQDASVRQPEGRTQDSRTQCGAFGIQQNRSHLLGLGGVPLEHVERQAILDTLRQTAGNRTRAAKVLGISDKTLREKIRRYKRESNTTQTPQQCLQPSLTETGSALSAGVQDEVLSPTAND